VTPPGWMERLYRLLLRVYPTRFRQRFGDGMCEAFGQEAAAARAAGAGRFLRFTVLTLADVLRFGLAERRPAARWRPTSYQPPGVRMRSAFTTDWRDAWRALASTPLVSTIAVLSLALGIGANLALFSILNGLLYKTLPVRNPDRLALLDQGSWTNPIWEQVRNHASEVADGGFAWAVQRFDLSATGADVVDGLYVSGRMFDVLGVDPARGQLLTDRDDSAALPDGAVAVISDRFWRDRFGRAADAVGRSISIERVPFTIVGVTPPGFFGVDVGGSFDVAIPLATERLIRGTASSLAGRRSWWMNIMLRLRPGQTLADATAALRAVQPQIRAETLPPGVRAEEEYLEAPLTLVSGASGRSWVRTRYERPLTAIMIVAGAVLLVACANIANLMLARAVARRHELSVRIALGASRLRVSRQLLAESALMTVAGTLAGSLFAVWASGALVAQISTPGLRVFIDLATDWRVVAFGAGLAVAIALLFGLAPALGVSALQPNEALKAQSRGSGAEGRFAMRHVLVVLQVALSLALVVAAGLLTRTFVSLDTRPAGFDRDSTLVARVGLRAADFRPEIRLDLLERMRSAAAALPGVSEAALSFTTPVSNTGWNTRIQMAGRSLNPRARTSWVNAVSPGWFRTYGVRMAEGRDFTRADMLTTRVAVVNRSFARKFLATEHPIGLTFSEDPPAGEPAKAPVEVVGLVEDAVYRSLRSEMTPTMYIPLGMEEQPTSMALGVRVASGDPLALSKAVEAVIGREAPQATVVIRSLADQVAASLAQERLVARLSAFFGGLALVLAALGLYGVTAYAVTRRRVEIGIRMALGANPASVVRLVIVRVGWLVGLGIVAGGALSLWAVRFIATLLYGLEPWDPATFAGAAAILGAVSALAGWIPARRASRIDPTIALRP
jgi:putative ABC transport system permease protein